MKKYKLIKEYPGSPKLNTVFDYWTDGISEQIYNKSNNPSFIPLKTVHQYPEFWEAINTSPVFQTLKGEDIFDGDIYYYTSSHNPAMISHDIARSNINYDTGMHIVRFKTLKECNDFIYLNTKRFSIVDIENYLPGKGTEILLKELNS